MIKLLCERDLPHYIRFLTWDGLGQSQMDLRMNLAFPSVPDLLIDLTCLSLIVSSLLLQPQRLTLHYPARNCWPSSPFVCLLIQLYIYQRGQNLVVVATPIININFTSGKLRAWFNFFMCNCNYDNSTTGWTARLKSKQHCVQVVLK